MATEQHIGTQDARSGMTLGIMRYVLAISLGLAAGTMALILLISYQP